MGTDIIGGTIKSTGDEDGITSDVLIKNGTVFLDEERKYRINGKALRLRHLSYIGIDDCRYLDIFNKFKIVDVKNHSLSSFIAQWNGDMDLEDGRSGIYVKDDIYIKNKLYINGIDFKEYENQIDKNSTDIAGLKDAISSLRSTVSSIKSCNCS